MGICLPCLPTADAVNLGVDNVAPANRFFRRVAGSISLDRIDDRQTELLVTLDCLQVGERPQAPLISNIGCTLQSASKSV